MRAYNATAGPVTANATAQGLPYLLRVPSSPVERLLPLLIFLHGAGESGTDPWGAPARPSSPALGPVDVPHRTDNRRRRTLQACPAGAAATLRPRRPPAGIRPHHGQLEPPLAGPVHAPGPRRRLRPPGRRHHRRRARHRPRLERQELARPPRAYGGRHLRRPQARRSAVPHARARACSAGQAQTRAERRLPPPAGHSPPDRVDPDRIYLTGLSMGGAGAFSFGASFAPRLAAVAPVCGSGGHGVAAKLKARRPGPRGGKPGVTTPQHATGVAYETRRPARAAAGHADVDRARHERRRRPVRGVRGDGCSPAAGAPTAAGRTHSLRGRFRLAAADSLP